MAVRPAPRPPGVVPTAGWGPTTSVRRRISRFSRSCGLLDHSFCQWATGKAVKARMSGAASASSSATWAKGSRSCSTTIGRGPRRETVAGRWCVPCEKVLGGHSRLGTLGHSGEQVGHEVGAAALPAGSSKHRGDGVLQPLVGIASHPAEAPSGQRPQEGQRTRRPRWRPRPYPGSHAARRH